MRIEVDDFGARPISGFANRKANGDVLVATRRCRSIETAGPSDMTIQEAPSAGPSRLPPPIHPIHTWFLKVRTEMRVIEVSWVVIYGRYVGPEPAREMEAYGMQVAHKTTSW